MTREKYRDLLMITIRIRNVKSVIDKHLPLLEEKLSTLHPKYWHSTKYNEGTWDGRTHFLDLKTGKFPTGHLHLVTEWLIEEELEYQIIDERKEIVVDMEMLKLVRPEMLHGITLREDQLSAITAGIVHCRGVIQMPTGTGKTEVAIGLTRLLDLPTLFLVNSKSLLYQTQERFIKRLGLSKDEIGIFGDGIYAPGEFVTIATVQSLDQMKKDSQKKFGAFLKAFPVLMFDECHHASAKTWYTAGTWAHNSYYRFGFSGTPMDREEIDSMKLMAVVGQPIYKRKTQDAIEDGDLCKIEMNMIENAEEVLGYAWQEIYTKAIVNSRQRNDMIADLAVEHYRHKRKVLILVRILEHGWNLKKKLQGWPVRFLNGGHSQEDREETIQWFSEGSGILIASGIFDEGIDIPEINVLIVASGGKSDVKSIQRIGRGLRKKSEGVNLKAYDFEDASEYLREHSAQRRKIYKREGYLDEDDD